MPKFEYPLSFVSIIIPTLNEADNIKSLLEIFDNLDESVFEVIISDSAVSRDDMSFLAQKRYVKYIKSGQTGRAYQMNDGAKIAHQGCWISMLPLQKVMAYLQVVVIRYTL